MRAIAGSIVISAGSLLIGMMALSSKPIESFFVLIGVGVILFGAIVVVVGLASDKPSP